MEQKETPRLKINRLFLLLVFALTGHTSKGQKNVMDIWNYFYGAGTISCRTSNDVYKNIKEDVGVPGCNNIVVKNGNGKTVRSVRFEDAKEYKSIELKEFENKYSSRRLIKFYQDSIVEHLFSYEDSINPTNINSFKIYNDSIDYKLIDFIRVKASFLTTGTLYLNGSSKYVDRYTLIHYDYKYHTKPPYEDYTENHTIIRIRPNLLEKYNQTELTDIIHIDTVKALGLIIVKDSDLKAQSIYNTTQYNYSLLGEYLVYIQYPNPLYGDKRNDNLEYTFHTIDKKYIYNNGKLYYDYSPISGKGDVYIYLPTKTFVYDFNANTPDKLDLKETIECCNN